MVQQKYNIGQNCTRLARFFIDFLIGQ